MATLPLDDNSVPTSAQYADPTTPAPGASEWMQYNVTADGGDVAQGAKADAAVTNSASTGTLIAFVKGSVSLLTSILAKLTAGAASFLHLEDEAAASGDAGVGLLGVRRDTGGTQVGTDGDYEAVQLVGGRVRVITDGEETDLSNASSTALEATNTVSAGAAKLWGFQGRIDTGGTDAFLLVFDNASGATTGTPVISLSVLAGGSFSLNLGPRGRAFTNGIVIAYSTTGASFTTGGSFMWVDAQYE